MDAKRRAMALLGLGAVAAVAACGGAAPGATGGDEDARVLRVGHPYEPSHPFETCGFPAMSEALEGSGLRVDTFPSSQLGSDAEMLEQVPTGSLDMSMTSGAFLGAWYPPAEVLDAAYLFDDRDAFNRIMEGPIVEQLWADMNEETGLFIVSDWYYGARHVTANEPVQDVEDLAGVKIRTPGASLYLANMNVLGGSATPMALPEVYLALQQGVIDAQENPIATISAIGIDEVQDYISLTGHMQASIMLISSDAVMDSLTEEERQALLAAADVGGEAAQECLVAQEEEILAEWRAGDGIQVVDDVDRETFAERAEEMLPTQFPAWADLYRQIREEQG